MKQPLSSLPASTTPDPEVPRTQKNRWLERAVLLVALLGIFTITFGAQLTPWIRAAFASTAGSVLPLWVAAALWQSALIGLPLLLLLRWHWSPRTKAILQTWLVAIGYCLVMAPSRWIPAPRPQLLLLSQILLTLIFWFVLRRLGRPFQQKRVNGRTWLTAGALALFVLPWLGVGALGSPLDTLFALILSLVFGHAAARLVDITWQPVLAADLHGNNRDLLTGGFVVGTVLLIMSSALSFNGTQLLLMITLPACAWFVLVAGHTTRKRGNLIAATTATVLLLVDTDALHLLALDPLLGAYFVAASVALLVGWLMSTTAVVVHLAPVSPLSGLPARALVMILWIGVAAIYFLVGAPGFFGDRIFVVMAEQADVTDAATIEDYDLRRHDVYTQLVEHAERTQMPIQDLLNRLAVPYTPYYLVNGLEVQGGLFLQMWLETRREVDRVLPSPRLRPLPFPLPTAEGDALAPLSPQWNLTSIGATQVWHELGITGEGIVIGQSDSGVQPDHAEYAQRYRGKETGDAYNWFDPWYGTSSPVDHSGHGTHTLGTILGDNVGVAPGATWFACANLVRNLGNPALYLDCLQFVFAPFPQGGDPLHDGDPTRSAHVLNNSWGCPQEAEGCDPASLRPAVEALRAAGIFVVASAGNDGPRCGTVAAPIAIYDGVFSVGALDAQGNLAPFSSVGPVEVDNSQRIKPDILAPGVEILSAYPGGTYAFADGTSMAGPHVAGVVALIWSANPALIGDIPHTEAILIEAAQPFTGTLGALFPAERSAESEEAVGAESPVADLLDGPTDAAACLAQTDLSTVPNNVSGYGVVDAYRAVQLALDLP